MKGQGIAQRMKLWRRELGNATAAKRRQSGGNAERRERGQRGACVL